MSAEPKVELPCLGQKFSKVTMAQRFWRKASFRIQPVLSPNLARHQAPSVAIKHSSVVTHVCVGTTPTTSASSRASARTFRLTRTCTLEATMPGTPTQDVGLRRKGNVNLLNLNVRDESWTARTAYGFKLNQTHQCFRKWTQEQANQAPAPQT
ncbi:hypothetical protein [Mesorhizobium sp. KR2-14]|uniref:hypothetical protein n=1 Tax=Mesorhizobium sp. KR2-14 TaxID=3156610 RepID=UPI0032B5ECB2